MVDKFLKPRTAATWIVGILALILLIRHSQDFQTGANVPGDFKVYQRAVTRVQNGANPYVQSDSSPYKYSPGALVPLQLLPQNDAHAWMIFKLLCLLFFVGSILIGAQFRHWKEVGYLLIGMIVAWKGLLETLDYGQIEFLLLFGAVLSAALFQRRIGASGFVLGLLPWFKLPWGFLAVPFIVKAVRQGSTSCIRLAAGYGVGFFGLGLLAPLLAYGYQKTFLLMKSWIDLLAHQPRDLYLVNVNQSIWSTGMRWIELNQPVGLILTGVSTVLCIAFLCLLVRKTWCRSLNEAPLAEMTPWLILMQLINPLSWRWGSMLLVGAAFAADPLTSDPKKLTRLWVMLIALVFALQLNPVAKALGWRHWTDLHQYGLITVYWMLILFYCLKNNQKTADRLLSQ